MHTKAGWRSFLVIFGLSFSIDLFLVCKLPPAAVLPTMQWEATSVGITLARTGTFGNPYALPTGPTAHLPPIPPAINALIYKAFGVTLDGRVRRVGGRRRLLGDPLGAAAVAGGRLGFHPGPASTPASPARSFRPGPVTARAWPPSRWP